MEAVAIRLEEGASFFGPNMFSEHLAWKAEVEAGLSPDAVFGRDASVRIN